MIFSGVFSALLNTQTVNKNKRQPCFWHFNIWAFYPKTALIFLNKLISVQFRARDLQLGDAVNFPQGDARLPLSPSQNRH